GRGAGAGAEGGAEEEAQGRLQDGVAQVLQVEPAGEAPPEGDGDGRGGGQDERRHLEDPDQGLPHRDGGGEETDRQQGGPGPAHADAPPGPKRARMSRTWAPKSGVAMMSSARGRGRATRAASTSRPR